MYVSIDIIYCAIMGKIIFDNSGLKITLSNK